MKEKLITHIQKILNDWNPLGENRHAITDLDNYYTEAIDIIFNLEMESKISAATAETITREVLNQAFNLHLTKQDCKEASRKIYSALKNAK